MTIVCARQPLSGGHGGNEEQVGTGRCRAREGDRFAFAVISLALDEVGAALMPRQRCRREREWQARPDADRPDACFVTEASARVAAQLAESGAQVLTRDLGAMQTQAFAAAEPGCGSRGRIRSLTAAITSASRDPIVAEPMTAANHGLR